MANINNDSLQVFLQLLENNREEYKNHWIFNLRTKEGGYRAVTITGQSLGWEKTKSTPKELADKLNKGLFFDLTNSGYMVYVTHNYKKEKLGPNTILVHDGLSKLSIIKK